MQPASSILAISTQSGPDFLRAEPGRRCAIEPGRSQQMERGAPARAGPRQGTMDFRRHTSGTESDWQGLIPPLWLTCD
jgi:hypothetical protein